MEYNYTLEDVDKFLQKFQFYWDGSVREFSEDKQIINRKATIEDLAIRDPKKMFYTQVYSNDGMIYNGAKMFVDNNSFEFHMVKPYTRETYILHLTKFWTEYLNDIKNSQKFVNLN